VAENALRIVARLGEKTKYVDRSSAYAIALGAPRAVFRAVSAVANAAANNAH